MSSNNKNSFKTNNFFNVTPNIDLDKKIVSGQTSEIDIGQKGILNNFLAYRQYVGNIDQITTGYSYIFMTKPNLNLSTDVNNITLGQVSEDILKKGSEYYNIHENSFFKLMGKNYPQLIQNLNYTDSTTGGFINIISNRFENFSGLNDISMATQTSTETFKGNKITLPLTYAGSISGGSITIEFTEMDPPIILYLHKIWIDYVEKIKFGLLEPSEATIANKEIDYASSLYYFLTGPDGETIKFWAKFTGVIPQSLPLTPFSSGLGERNLVKESFQYMYSYAEYLNPDILAEFNAVSLGKDLVPNGNEDIHVKLLFGLIDIPVSSSKDTSHDVSSMNSNNYNIPTESQLDENGQDSGIYKKVGIYQVNKQSDGRIGTLDYKLKFYN